jgi:serine/threonine-protein kinase
MSDLAPGTIIDGRYKVLSRIGSGGMADVYLAEDELLSRNIAVKVLQHRFVEDEEFVERFRREASAAAGLSHPSIVAIYDRGSWNGTYYIAMEYLPGRTLKRLVREHGAIDPDSAIEIAVAILHAASFAHRHGIVHRDIKPHNVILGDEGRVTVTDFGIARAGASDMTHTGSIMGTAQYLSPEQAQGHQVSAASDIYAVGILLYELLTGRVPFEGESAVAIALQHLSSPAPPPSSVNPAVPSALDAVVLRALEKDPADRYPDADQFIAALEAAKGTIDAGAAMPQTAALAGAAATAAAPMTDVTALYAAPILAPGQIEPAPDGTNQPLPAAAASSEPLPGYGAGPGGFEPLESEEESERRRKRRLWLAGGAAALLVAGGIAAALALTSSTAEVTVPSLVGQTQAAAVKQLRSDGLVPIATPAPSAAQPPGVVASQRPAPGSVIQQGSRVYLTVSTGAGTVVVPKVAGLPEARAKELLSASGLEPVVQQQANGKVTAGLVISTDPPAGLDAQQGTAVTVFVSSGPGGSSPGAATVRVPEVIGLTQHDAAETLATVGLTVGAVTRSPSTAQPAGRVISQVPAAGGSLARGESVELVVAETPPEVPIPNVVGKSKQAAETALRKAGLKVKSNTLPVINSSENGRVVEQSPAAGHKITSGSTVTISVGALTQPQTTTSTTTTAAPGAVP